MPTHAAAPSPPKSQIRSTDYRAKARSAAALAKASVLSHVREQHRHAAAVWRSLAVAEERRTAELSKSRIAAPRPKAMRAPQPVQP